MTAKQVAAALRMQAHSLTIAKNKLQTCDELNPRHLMVFTLQLIEELANHKVAQALMLENLSENLSGVDFSVLSQFEDLTPLGKPPIDID